MKITDRDMIITVANKEPCDENHPYFTVNVEAMSEAARNLSDDAFVLWMYFAKNQNGSCVDLSPDDAAKWGVKRSSFDRLMDELTKRGYIKDLGRDIFIFYENPENHK